MPRMVTQQVADDKPFYTQLHCPPQALDWPFDAPGRERRNKIPIIASVRVADFAYSLPEELIAQEPLADRAASRLLHLNRSITALRDCRFRDFPELLRADDLLVFNNTRVFPARLYGRRSGARAQPLSPDNPASRTFLRGTVEVLLTRRLSQEPNDWEGLVRPGRKIGVGERLFFGEG